MTFVDPGPLSSVRQSEVLAGLENVAAQLCKEGALTAITQADFLQGWVWR